MLPYTWTVRLGKIAGIGHGTWKNSGPSSGMVEGNSQILGLGGPRRKNTKRVRLTLNSSLTRKNK